MPNKTHTSSPSPAWNVEALRGVRANSFQKDFFEKNYLRTNESIEARLMAVARTAALAELVHDESSSKWPLYDGLRVSRKDTPHPDRPGQFQRLVVLNAPGLSETERELNFFRFLSNLNSIVKNHQDAAALVRRWTDSFYDLLAGFEFIPGSPVLMNAGRPPHQMASCFAVQVPDSLEGITRALQIQALIHKTGAGTGFTFERIRPAGDVVQSTSGPASGVINFLHAFDTLTAVVKKGGNKRGANMGVLPYWHPEIRDFIALKSRPGRMGDFNLGVLLDSDFMKAVEEDRHFEFKNPRTGEPAGRGSARTLFDILIESVWKTGSPRIFFIDRINASPANPRPDLGNPSIMNPRGEQPLYPNEACHLGSLNLSLFVENKDGHPATQWERLEKAVFLAVRFLDNLIDVNHYPFPEMEHTSKLFRRIGLGVTGFADFLVKKNISYDSDEAVSEAREVMAFIQDKAASASAALAKEKGPFPRWKGSIYDADSPHYWGQRLTVRNAARTTIAATENISLAGGADGKGIEPFSRMIFSQNPQGGARLKNEMFETAAKQNENFGFSRPELEALIEKNGGRLKGLKEIPESVQTLFSCAPDVSPARHLDIQAAFQAHVDHAVAKTIYLPKTAGPDTVERLVWEGYRKGLKGLAFYREGADLEPLLAPRGLDGESRQNVLEWETVDTFLEKGPAVLKIGYYAGRAWVLDGQADDPEEDRELKSLCLFVTGFLKNGGALGPLVKDLEPSLAFEPGEFGDLPRLTPPQAVLATLKGFLIRHGLQGPLDMQAGGIDYHQTDDDYELWRLLDTGRGGESVH